MQPILRQATSTVRAGRRHASSITAIHGCAAAAPRQPRRRATSTPRRTQAPDHRQPRQPDGRGRRDDDGRPLPRLRAPAAPATCGAPSARATDPRPQVPSGASTGAYEAVELRDLGARVSFVTGPARVPPPSGVDVYPVQTAQEMLAGVERLLPVDAAVFAAAVADWRIAGSHDQKIKKKSSGDLPVLKFAENPDILARVSAHEIRPQLVVGFAAETENVIENATAKRLRKGCDWIVANDVSPATGIMGGSENAVVLISEAGSEVWPRMAKDAVARRLADRIAAALAD